MSVTNLPKGKKLCKNFSSVSLNRPQIKSMTRFFPPHGDQMSLKSRPKCCPTHFCRKWIQNSSAQSIIHNIGPCSSASMLYEKQGLAFWAQWSTSWTDGRSNPSCCKVLGHLFIYCFRKLFSFTTFDQCTHQGCQIILGAKYQTGEKYTKLPLCKHYKWP
jgi:hypothetical protein